MDEAWWLTCTDPAAMLRLVTENPDHANISCISERKLRLFACACCLLRGTPVVVVDAYEREGAPYDCGIDEWVSDREWAKKWTEVGANKPTLKMRSALLRDIIGNPFRPVTLCVPAFVLPGGLESRTTVLSGWLTPQVLTIAQTIYDTRDFAALPVLADALEDSGADSVELLEHLRSPGPHVKGCWALDLILGKN